MAKHEVVYDEQGLSTNDPWSLDEYLEADRFIPAEKKRITESVLSWLREYDEAGCNLNDLIRELDLPEEPE